MSIDTYHSVKNGDVIVFLTGNCFLCPFLARIVPASDVTMGAAMLSKFILFQKIKNNYFKKKAQNII